MSLFDSFRKKADLAAPKTKQQVLTPVTIDWMVNTLFEMRDPDETLRNLGISRSQLVVLESDDEITAAMDTRREAVISTPWRLEPGTSELESWLWNTLEPNIEEIIRGALRALPYGYAVQQVIFQQDGNRIGIKSVESMPFSAFSFRADGTLLGRLDRASEPVPVMEKYPSKFLLTQYRGSLINPYGEALFSRLWWPWYFRTNGWKFWAKALERTATPFLKGTAPIGMVQDKDGNMINTTDALNIALQSAVQNASISLSEGWDVEFMSAPQTGSSFELFETACTKRMQRLILGQTLTSDTGQGGGGSYALGQVHNEVRMDRRNADIRLVTKTIQQLISYLWAVNGFTGSVPSFVMEDGTGLEMERANRDATLLPVMQASGVRLTREYYLDKFDLEVNHLEDVETPEPVAPPGNQPDPAKPEPKADFSAMTFAPAQKVGQDQDALDDGVDALIEDAEANQKMMEAMLKPVIKLIKNSGSYHEVQQELAALYPKMKQKDLEQKMAKALFVSDVWGRLNADQR